MIHVRVFHPQWAHLAPNLELDLGERDVAVADLLAELRIDPAEIGIVTVNGRQSGLDEIVPAASRVCIFPPMFGG
jgi:sulfur carrier protein ThiS